MRNKSILFALFILIGMSSAYSQVSISVGINTNRGYDVYRDDCGDYRWDVRQIRVYEPEYRRYVCRPERYKVYVQRYDYRDRYYSRGYDRMPYGQRKKYERENRYERRDRDDDRGNRYANDGDRRGRRGHDDRD